jgi:hypothetical protein
MEEASKAQSQAAAHSLAIPTLVIFGQLPKPDTKGKLFAAPPIHNTLNSNVLLFPLSSSSSPPPPLPPPPLPVPKLTRAEESVKVPMTFKFNLNYDDEKNRDPSFLVSHLCELLNIPKSRVVVKGVSRGSVIFHIEYHGHHQEFQRVITTEIQGLRVRDVIQAQIGSFALELGAARMNSQFNKSYFREIQGCTYWTGRAQDELQRGGYPHFCPTG